MSQVLSNQLSFDEVRRIKLNESDTVAQIIFEQCYQRNPTVQHNWNSAQYQAPESWTGWTARNAQHAANEIRRLSREAVVA